MKSAVFVLTYRLFQTSRTFTAEKAFSEAQVKEEYRSGVRNFLTEFRSGEDALSVCTFLNHATMLWWLKLLCTTGEY